jgi:hypothetical protein
MEGEGNVVLELAKTNGRAKIEIKRRIGSITRALRHFS